MTKSNDDQLATTKKAFSLADIRNDQNFDEQAAIEKHTPKVEVKRPSKFIFFRTLAPKENWIEASVVDDGTGGDIFLVSNAIRHSIEDYCRPVLLVPCLDPQGNVLIWLLKLGKEGYPPLRWHTSAREAAIRALTHWTQMTSDKKINAYTIKTAEGDLPEPVWPDQMDIETLIQEAFEDNFIDSLDHLVVQRLRGLV